MNANELADYLEKAFYADEDISKAATMLRQLQDENEELKLKLNTTLTNRNLRTYDGKES